MTGQDATNTLSIPYANVTRPPGCFAAPQTCKPSCGATLASPSRPRKRPSCLGVTATWRRWPKKHQVAEAVVREAAQVVALPGSAVSHGPRKAALWQMEVDDETRAAGRDVLHPGPAVTQDVCGRLPRRPAEPAPSPEASVGVIPSATITVKTVRALTSAPCSAYTSRERPRLRKCGP
jgi:hypothetical protein